MQLGNAMNDTNASTGVAVDLTWGSYMSTHDQFGFKNSGGTFINALGGTTALTGLHHIVVLVDLASRTFDIRIDNVLRVSAEPFRSAAVTQISQMRFFQDQMTATATGRTFDNVVLTQAVVADNFTRTNSTTIGGGWTEFLTATNPGDASISSSRLLFSVANGTPASPVVSKSFSAVGAGTMTWAFTMSFTRTAEVTYFQFMQLGYGMNTSSQSTGVAVDLSWGSYGAAHNQFGYKSSVGAFINVMGGTTQLAGAHYVVVKVDLGAGTYDVIVDGIVRATAVQFRDPAVMQISEVRFFEDQMDSTATGRAFDNVALTLP
jgi:hypothetical protein